VANGAVEIFALSLWTAYGQRVVVFEKHSLTGSRLVLKALDAWIYLPALVRSVLRYFHAVQIVALPLKQTLRLFLNFDIIKHS
jgi:hypothetical protein